MRQIPASNLWRRVHMILLTWAPDFSPIFTRVRHLEADDDAITVYGRTDYRDPEGARGGNEDCRCVPQARHLATRTFGSEATFYKYKGKYGGMEVSDARRLKALEDENSKLNKLLAEQMLVSTILKDVAAKKW